MKIDTFRSGPIDKLIKVHNSEYDLAYASGKIVFRQAARYFKWLSY